MKLKRSDFSLSAVFLFFILALFSMAVFAVNETNSTDYTNITENKTIEVNVTEVTNQTEEVNETLPLNETNQTQPVNQTDKTISLDLKYKSGTEWDPDDDGLEAMTGIIDLDVGSTEFSWEIDESKLCTKWEVYSVENNNLTRLCFGSEKCCALMDLQPALSSWKDALEIYFGRYGASLLNRITAQVIYADYNLSIEDPFSEFYNSNTTELTANFSQENPEVIFGREIVCDKCSNHKVSPLTEFIMVISAGISNYFEGILSDYIPSAFTVVNPIGGSITEINENYTRIDWDVVGDNISREYILRSPNRTMPASKYYFYSELNNKTSDEWMVVVADREIANQTGCTIPDVTFSTNDMQISRDTATFDKDGLAITLRGIATGRIKNLPVFKDNTLTVDSSIAVKNATIALPHCGAEPVMIKPRLYIREKGMEFKEAVPYCYNKTIEKKRNVTVEGVCDKENDPFCLSVKDEIKEITETETTADFENCFNDVEITPTQYIFNVEHFTDYYINSTTGFKTLAACLKSINNTGNTCVINEPGYYDINKWQINASDSSFNKSGLKLAYDFDINHTSNMITYDSSDSGNNGDVLNATWNATGYYGGAYDFNGSNTVINGTYNAINLNEQSYTISVWFNARTNKNFIIGKYSVGGACNTRGYFIKIDQTTNKIVYSSSNSSGCQYPAVSTTSVQTGQWYNVVGVHNITASQTLLYINGILESTNNTVIGHYEHPTASPALTIGRASVASTTTTFNGTIDQLRIWNRSLSKREIEEQYTGAVAKYNLNSHGIKITSNNTVINLHGSTIIGDGGNGEYGIYYYRKGGNITLENCIIEGFYNNYRLDSYGDSSDKGFFIKNCTSISGVSGDSFSYENYTIQNFTGENTKGISLLKTYGLYEDIYLNCSGSIAGESCLFINQGDRNIFRRLNITTPSEPPAGLNSAIYLTDGGTSDGAQNNTIEDSYIKAPKIKALSMYIFSNYDNLIRNTTIEDSGTGIEILLPSNSIVNNTFKNISRQAIIYKNSGVSDKEINITNNIIINAGNGTRATSFRMSYSPLTYNGINFTCVLLFNSAVSSQKIDEEDELITMLDGNDNATKLWLYTDNETSPVLGCGKSANVTLYAEAGFPYTCAQIATTYKGTCRLAYEDTPIWITNGIDANYTFNTSILNTAPVQTGYTTPPYLRLRNESWQEAFPVEVITGSNWANITGNTIEITDGRQNYGSMNITADTSYNTNVWLNNFYSSVPVRSGNAYFCIDEEGNFYEQSLNKTYIEDVLKDCGLANITGPNGGEVFDKSISNIITINWTKQSSQNTISYLLYYSDNVGTSWNYIDSTNALTYDWDISLLSAGSNYLVKVIPYDNYYNATNDQSDSTFTITTSLDNEWVCSNPSICEYQTITSALDGENNTANTIYIMGSNAVYTVSDIVSYNATPIQINATNITLDCNNTKLVGTGSGYGIFLYNQSNNTIKNCNVTNYLYGIYLRSFSNNNALINNVANNNTDRGIYLRESSNNILINNSANLNTNYGIYFWTSSNNNLTNNIANNNTYYGIFLYGSSNNNLTNNIANSNGDRGILLYMSANNNIMAQNNVNSNTNYGILLWNSVNNTIINNNIDSNALDGLYLYNYSSNNIVVNNTITSSDQGIHFSGYCNNNILTNNTIRLSDYGIYFWTSSNNNLINNTITENNKTGILVRYNSDSNNITKNILNNSAAGSYDLNISTSDSGNNMVWLNNFSGNGVTNSGTNTIFCVNGQGNYYGPNAARPVGECQLDVYNLSVILSDGQFRIFKFKTKNIDTQANSINYTSLNTGEKDINSSQDIGLNVGKEIFTFVDYNYIGSGNFGITAYANSTLTDDEDKINITI